MLNDLIKLRNLKMPKSVDNVDALQFDYKFWTEIEKASKKARVASLDTLKGVCANPDTPGIILQTPRFITILKESAPVKTFDREAFIEEILKRVPGVSRHVIRECALAAMVEGNTRKTYTVEDNDA